MRDNNARKTRVKIADNEKEIFNEKLVYEESESEDDLMLSDLKTSIPPKKSNKRKSSKPQKIKQVGFKTTVTEVNAKKKTNEEENGSTLDSNEESENESEEIVYDVSDYDDDNDDDYKPKKKFQFSVQVNKKKKIIKKASHKKKVKSKTRKSSKKTQKTKIKSKSRSSKTSKKIGFKLPTCKIQVHKMKLVLLTPISKKGYTVKLLKTKYKKNKSGHLDHQLELNKSRLRQKNIKLKKVDISGSRRLRPQYVSIYAMSSEDDSDYEAVKRRLKNKKKVKKAKENLEENDEKTDKEVNGEKEGKEVDEEVTEIITDDDSEDEKIVKKKAKKDKLNTENDKPKSNGKDSPKNNGKDSPKNDDKNVALNGEEEDD